MARTVTEPSTFYTQGQVLSLNVNGFNSANADSLILTVTRENFPGTNEDDVIAGTILWSSGGSATFTVPGGVSLRKDGSILTEQSWILNIPGVTENGVRTKKPVSAGSCQLIFSHPDGVRTAVTLRAI